MNKAVFLDKDGTLVEDIPFNADPGKLRLLPGVAEGLRRLQQEHYLLIIITNQPGIALGRFKESLFREMIGGLYGLLEKEHVHLDGFYYCPHHPEGKGPYAVHCDCRKPLPGLILQAARSGNINLAASWMIGDILHDIEAGKQAGCRTILIDNGNETEWQRSKERTPDHIVDDMPEAARIITGKDRFFKIDHDAKLEGM